MVGLTMVTQLAENNCFYMKKWIVILLLLICARGFARPIVVDASGHGDFTTIQDALNSLPVDADAPRHILIRNGIYHEKIFIEKNNLILEGEDKEKTILTFSLARDAWRCEHKDDWGVATLNLRGSDITLENLTICNSYGFDNTDNSIAIPCAADSLNHRKVVGREGHQMALRSFQTTRLKVENCILKAFGGDTVSPWNVTAGMFYFNNCQMEGGVDFYCPRGWAYAEHCSFVADNGPACIWHDGSADPDSKTVLKDCSFSGYDGFKLGRYHRDAQFYLIDCHFAANMADQDIYEVPTAQKPQWGHRVYYYNCDKQGRAYTWYANNLDKAPGAPDPRAITPDWVFKDKWHPTPADTTSPAERLAITAMSLWPAEGDSTTARWTYDEGVVWKGLQGLWYNTGDARYFKFIQHQMDRLVDKDGNIRTYKLDDYNLDNVLCGRILLMLYQVTGQEKYYKAASTLRRQLKEQPRTSEGSFWHKKKYTEQVWLDGLYMAQPFFAEYAQLFHEDSVFDDIAKQFENVEKHTRDGLTGLLYHGWDEAHQQFWADKQTGHSANFWGRAMGWYGMALVDALDYFPADRPERQRLVAILQRYAAAIKKVQDPGTGCWWDVLDKPGVQGNYLEASASCMFAYTLAKGVRMGYLPEADRSIAEKAWQGILSKFLTAGSDGHTDLQGTVSVSGLGGTPNRDGSYSYYISEKVVPNDPKGVGAFLLAADEMEMRPYDGKTVLLDYYFNNERRKDITGAQVRYHYTWEDMANSGYSIWGHIFRMNGAHTDTLPVAPTKEDLKHASVYIITDPDNEKEAANPHYPSEEDIKAIEDWVKAGGVLVLMSNDSANCEFPHFNHLAERFGVHFDFDCYHKVIGNQFQMGAFDMTVQDGIFRTTKKIYIKELSTLTLNGPARSVFSDAGNNIMAVAQIGKGTVFAVGDPWFYNEYTDGRKLPADFENYNAARDLAQWLLGKSRKN
jgi:unsaturated rhamnogalacturonyl hydrolase